MTTGPEAARIAELVADNRRLRHLLERRDTPGELRHRLRSTLALLRAIIRRSAETGRERSDYAAQLEDRLDAVAHAQALADQHGTVDLRTLLADELLRYGATEGNRLLLSGPDVQLQPRTGQLLALAIHELAVNAVEHGVLGREQGAIEACWSVDRRAPTLLLSWVERDPSPGDGPACRGFGTEVLTSMLPYELKAATEIRFGATGLHVAIRLPLPGGDGGTENARATGGAATGGAHAA